MLHRSRQQRDQAEDNKHESKSSRSDYTMNLISGFDIELKEFVDAETKSDKRRRRAHPGHHGVFIGETRAVVGEFGRDISSAILKYSFSRAVPQDQTFPFIRAIRLTGPRINRYGTNANMKATNSAPIGYNQSRILNLLEMHH